MKRIRFLLCILLALCVLLPGLPAAAAEEPEEDARFADKTWDEVVEDFLEKWGADPKSLTMGYYNTVTGEEHYLNPDQYMVSGSMYKVPLNMAFVAKITAGEMDWETNIGSIKYETLLEGSIVYSDNNYAKTLWSYLGNGTYRTYRRIIAPIMGEDPDTVDAKFYENNFFTARQMIYCLRELYENQDVYPRIIETMQRAEPHEYFKRYEQRFDIAHKYGFLQTEYHLYMNDCGICFTDDPILIVLFTDNVTKAYEVMADFCTLMCEYTQYHTALRLEEEAAEAERQRQEAERLAQEAEEQARQAAQQAEQEAESIEQEGVIRPLESPERSTDGATADEQTAESGSSVLHLVRRAEEDGLSRTGIMAAAAAILLTLAAWVVLAVLGKKYRVKAGLAALLSLLMLLGALGRIGWPAYQKWQNRPEGDPRATVSAFLDALERQDYPAAYALLDGVETLGLEWQPEDETLAAILQAVAEQFDGELYGECRVDGSRAYQQVTCSYLDVQMLEKDARSETLRYISRYANSHKVSELYDENNNYRPELMREGWAQAIPVLLENSKDYMSSSGVELELVWYDGAWHIVPGERLLVLLTGGLRLTGEEGQP